MFRHSRATLNADQDGRLGSSSRDTQSLRFGAIVLAVAAVMGAVTASSAQAATADFNFQSPAGDVGSNTQSYTASGVSITASGLTGSIIGPMFFQTGSVDLFDKTLGGDESGLGLANDVNDEIHNGSFVEIAMPTGVTAVSFNMGSTTGDDAWGVYGCTGNGTGCTLLTSGADELTHSLALDPFYFFTETGTGTDNPNVLLANLNVTTTPIPAALPLFGSGLVALFGFAKRKRRQALALA